MQPVATIYRLVSSNLN